MYIYTIDQLISTNVKNTISFIANKLENKKKLYYLKNFKQYEPFYDFCQVIVVNYCYYIVYCAMLEMKRLKQTVKYQYRKKVVNKITMRFKKFL